MKNENKNDEMVSILKCLQRYAPTLQAVDSFIDPETNEAVTITSQQTHWLLIGGDQLTVERIIGCRRSRSNADVDSDKLKEFIPVVEDWHSKVAILKVCMLICRVIYLACWLHITVGTYHSYYIGHQSLFVLSGHLEEAL